MYETSLTLDKTFILRRPRAAEKLSNATVI